MELFAHEDFDRLDLFLAQQPEIGTRSQAQKCLKEGRVHLVGSSEELSAKRRVQQGETFLLDDKEAGPAAEAVELPLEIVYEDEQLLVVNKPKGMVVHPAAGHESDTLVNSLMHHCTLSQVDGFRPGIVHRIDKDTSGLLLVAKENRTHEDLAEQLFQHKISRVYLGLCWGIPEGVVGKVDRPLGRHPQDRKKQAIRNNGREAITHWRKLEELGGISLMEFTLETGRTHQIRVHLSSIGHPLVGDQVYGSYREFVKLYPEELREQLRHFQGQALHAASLGFVHPISQEWMEFRAEPPACMAELILALRNWKKNHES